MVRNVYGDLKALVADGYLLHGSNKKFNIIEPHRKDKIDPRAGLLEAVYATDDPLMAMFLAIIRPKKLPIINGKHKNMISWEYVDDKLRCWISPNFNIHNAYATGWIYVTEGSLFKSLKKLPHEYYSHKKVVPTKIIEVKPKDFLSIVELEVIPVEDVREAGFHTEEEIKAMGYD